MSCIFSSRELNESLVMLGFCRPTVKKKEFSYSILQDFFEEARLVIIYFKKRVIFRTNIYLEALGFDWF